MEKDEDVALYAISIDDAKKSNRLAEKIAKDGKGEVMFPLLSDPDNKTIDEYGLFDTRYVGKGVEGIPQPAVFILNEKKEIVWANVEADYSKRPSIEMIRSELDKLKKLKSKSK